MEAEATSGAAPTDGGGNTAAAADGQNENKRTDDAEMRVAVENGVMDRFMHPDRDAGFLSGDENAATRVAALAAIRGKVEAREMPKTAQQPSMERSDGQETSAAVEGGGVLGVENCVGNILNGLEYIRAAGNPSTHLDTIALL